MRIGTKWQRIKELEARVEALELRDVMGVKPNCERMPLSIPRIPLVHDISDTAEALDGINMSIHDMRRQIGEVMTDVSKGLEEQRQHMQSCISEETAKQEALERAFEALKVELLLNGKAMNGALPGRAGSTGACEGIACGAAPPRLRAASGGGEFLDASIPADRTKHTRMSPIHHGVSEETTTGAHRRKETEAINVDSSVIESNPDEVYMTAACHGGAEETTTGEHRLKDEEEEEEKAETEEEEKDGSKFVDSEEEEANAKSKLSPDFQAFLDALDRRERRRAAKQPQWLSGL